MTRIRAQAGARVTAQPMTKIRVQRTVKKRRVASSSI